MSNKKQELRKKTKSAKEQKKLETLRKDLDIPRGTFYYAPSLVAGEYRKELIEDMSYKDMLKEYDIGTRRYRESSDFSIEFKIKNLDEVGKKLGKYFDDHPTWYKYFDGVCNLRIGEKKVLASRENLDFEVVSWMETLCKNKTNYEDPLRYIPEIVEAYRKCRQTHPPNSPERLNFKKLSFIIDNPGNIFIQSPSQDILEVSWDLPHYFLDRTGIAYIKTKDFNEELEKEKEKMALQIFEKFPQLKKTESFKFLNR